MDEEKQEFKKLLKRKSPIKMPSNLEAVYDPQTGAFIGRRPVRLLDPDTGKEIEIKFNKNKKDEEKEDF